MRKVLILLTLLLVVAFPVMAQESTPEATAEATMQADTGGSAENAEDMAFVRFANFAPDAGAVSLTLDDEATGFENVEFGSVSDWMAIPAGTYNASAGAAQAAELNLAANTFSTVAAVPAEDGSVKLEVIDETFPELIPGTSYVTFVNAVPGGVPVDLVRDDVVYVPALASLGNPDGTTSWTGLRDDSGTFTMRFMESGTADTVVADLGEVDITEGNVYLIALLPTPEGGYQTLVHETPMADIWLVQGKMEEPGTIMDALRADDTLTPFADALEQAGLAETLNGEGPYTLFVPAGFLMDNIPADVMNDADALRTWLQGYIVEGDLKSMDVANAEQPMTALGGQTLTPETREDGIYLNGNQVIAVNIPATNGTIHMINGLLGVEAQQ
ncbi:MAG: fasciclin domain-containing protein [Chloroflexi bacterium]|nr:fasciclin domain-containing protein [Chloroflexota bacterium]